MANYFIKKQENKYHIMENATDQSVMTFDSYDAAKKQVKHLNSGGGFDGWTPAYLLQRFAFKK